MKSKNEQKRLKLSTETIRSLTADDVQNVIGGVAPGGVGPNGGEAGFTDSISISVRGNNCCNCK